MLIAQSTSIQILIHLQNNNKFFLDLFLKKGWILYRGKKYLTNKNLNMTNNKKSKTK